MKKRIAIFTAALALGILGGTLSNNYSAKADDYVTNGTTLTTNKELYKEVSSDIKIPSKVVLNSNSRMVNEQNNFQNTILDVIPETGTQDYRHFYYNNDHSSRVMFHVIENVLPTTVDASGVSETKEVKLDNGIVALYTNSGYTQTLSFNDLKTGLFYAFVGDSDEINEFSLESLLEMANSLE